MFLMLNLREASGRELVGSRSRCTLGTKLTYTGHPGFEDSAAPAAIVASLIPRANGPRRETSTAKCIA
jgi:hypothetical protein